MMMDDPNPAVIADDPNKENVKESEVLVVKEEGTVKRDSNNTIQCSSAKQCRKMNDCDSDSDGRSLSYTWKQTEIGAHILVKLNKTCPESLKKFDVTFTSTTANISLSEEDKHVIQLYDAIVKEKSKVELKKGNASLHIVKKRPGLWPCLEVKSEHGSTIDDNSDNSQRTISKEGKVVNENTSCSLKGLDSVIQGKEGSSDIKDMEEKAVYHLDHMKHDFFERDLLLTLQVFIKCLEKDAINIEFNKQGFVLRFRTSDARFLQLHEETSQETTFSWTVHTRGKIKPDACTFKIKPTVIEISLHKTSIDRWTTLEASVRKNNDSAKPNTWLPLNAIPGKAVNAVSASTSSASSQPNNRASDNKSSGGVMFDEGLSDVNLRDKGGKGLSYIYNQNQASSDTTLSAFSENLRFKSNVSQDFNKPTAKVHPLTKHTSEDVGLSISPGYAGLANLGNTCFMNCVLQVVANTTEFRDYFLDGRFQQEINEENPLGMKGHLAATFGTLLRWMWSCKRQCWEPRKLKDLISKKNPQFFGFAQHDAHEFLAFLLDGLHEDLNRIRKKPYTETMDSNGRPDEVVAGEAWSQYKKRNDSVVVDLFQGQYKSKLVCPKCGKVSITFDPFLYLSVPLPKKKKVIPVTFMWKEFYKKPHQFQIHVPQDSTVDHLVEILSQRTQVSASDIRVFEAFRGKIHKFFMAGSSLAHVESKDIIIACEVLSEELAGEEVLEIPVIQRTLSPTELPSRCAFCHKQCQEGIALKRCTKCYKAGYCDHSCQRNHWNVHKPQCSTCPEPIGCPFILSIPASRATYGYLVKLMEGFARFSINLFQPPVKPAEGVANHTSSAPVPTSNLSSSLSQSCSSLNSLDSLSSASSTCTLTGDQSDPQIQDDGPEAAAASSATSDSDSVNTASSASVSLSDSTSSGEVGDSAAKTANLDSGIDSSSSKSEKVVPKSQVMGVQAMETDRDKATPTFFIKPVTIDGVGIKGAERLEDIGDAPLALSSHKFLSMDWRNNGRHQSHVLVQSKELEGKKVDDRNNANIAASDKPTLYQCLDLFTEPEILKPEEAWYCPKCKKHVEASKQMAIWRLPHTLIIQLKRFSFQNFLMRSKIKKHVEFPTRGLDLRNCCVGVNSPDSTPPIYDLYGVANHHGLLIGGHYTSFVRCANSSGVTGNDEVGWRLCDDSRVTPIANEKSVVTADAYLLFYRRRGVAATIDSSPRQASSLPGPDIIPLDPGNGDDDSSDINGPGSVEEVEYNEAASLSSSSVVIGGGDSPSNKKTSPRLDGPSRGWGAGIVCEVAEESDEDELEEVRYGEEKGDREKEVCEWKRNDDDQFYSDDDDDREDNGRKLVIDSSLDLGYTDMEAVD